MSPRDWFVLFVSMALSLTACSWVMLKVLR
jgi:hypothetical protein